MKNKNVLIILTLMLLFILSGCKDGAGTTTGTGTKILLTISDENDSFRAALASVAQQSANSKNATLDVMNAEGVVENQVSQIKNAVTDGYDVIICIPVDIDTTRQLISAAGDLPIVFINSCPDEGLLEADKYVYVGSDENFAGEYQAQYILDNLNGKTDINVVLFEGEKGHSASIKRTDAVKYTFNESGINVNYVFVDYADWSGDKAGDMFNIFLKTNQNFDYVICNNDTMAIGILKAYKENGIDPTQKPILGIDATTEACEAIATGEMAFSVYQSSDGQGNSAVEAAIQLANGNSIKNLEYVDESLKYIWVPFEQVSYDNVSNYLK